MKKFINDNLFLMLSYLSTNKKIIKNIFYLFPFSLLFFCPISFAVTDHFLVKTIREGDVVAVGKLIQKGNLGVNQILQFREVNSYLSDEADYEYTPLMVAAASGLTAMTKKLIEWGAEPDQQVDDKTALMLAVSYGHKDVVMFLIEQGANVHLRNSEDFTILMLTVLGYNKEVATLLMEYLKSKNPDDSTDTELLAEVVSGCNVETLKQLTANQMDADIQSIISAMSSAGDDKIQIMISLIARGADINAQDKVGDTALMCAAATQNEKAIRLLLENEANTNISNKKGVTALMSASERRSTKIVELLIKNKANINARDNVGDTALMCAVREQHTQIARLLIDNKADPNIQNMYKKTALMYAKKNNDTEVMKLLIENGADANM